MRRLLFTSTSALVLMLAAADTRAEVTLELPPTSTVTSTVGDSRISSSSMETSRSSGISLGVEVPLDAALVRGLQDERLGQRGTTIGSYGMFDVAYLSVGPDAPFEGTATLRRLVLFVSHAFTEDFRGYVEAEWEHAVACSGCEGAVEVEQAFVDWNLVGKGDVVLRTGLVLVPFGIINQWHEPPVFHGVDRPRVDQLVIPSTWRELGLGATGRLFDVGRWELYLTTGPDVLGLGAGGLAGATTQGSLAPANGWMVSGRVEVEPLLGVVAGLSFVGGDLGGGPRFYDAAGDRDQLAFPLLGGAVDARWRRSGLEARVLATAFVMPNVDDLLAARRADGSLHFPAPETTGVPATLIAGGYVELAYDVLRAFDVGEHQLLPFGRLELYDTQAKVLDGFERDPRADVTEWTFGLSYRPTHNVVFKADYQLRDRRLGYDEKQANVGLGYMF